MRPVNWLWLPGYDAVAEAAPLPLAADPLHLLAEKMRLTLDTFSFHSESVNVKVVRLMSDS